MIDERQQNNVKAVLAAGVTLVFLLAFAFLVLLPIHEFQTQKMLEEIEVNCPEGSENCAVVVDPFPIWMLLGMPSVIVYFVTYRALEQRRIKNWRSYK